jgi:cobalt-zinc-cadmium efflux system protein
LVSPPSAAGAPILIVALVGIVVNFAATWALSTANRRSMNIEGSYQHILTDAFAFIATAIAGAVILATGFTRADGIASLVIAAIMLKAGSGLLRESTRVFLEAAPRDTHPDAVGQAIAGAPGVLEVHDLHIWEIASDFPALSAHVLVNQDCNCHAARRSLEALLHDQFGLEHTTLQVDHEGGELVELEAGEQNQRRILSDSSASEHMCHPRRPQA